MISSNSSKIISLAASALMVGASLVVSSAPAYAAAGDVTIKPSTGLEYAVFNDDAFELTTVVNSITGPSADATLAYEINNPDQHTIVIDFNHVGTETLTLAGYKANGEPVTVISASAITISTTDAVRSDSAFPSGGILVDFADLKITKLVISDMAFDGDLTPTFQVVADSAATTGVSKVLTDTEIRDLILDGGAVETQYSTAGLNDGNASVTVQAWIDTNSDTTDIEATYASAVERITWYDPANVSVVGSIQRMTATGSSGNAAAGISAGTTSFVARQDYLMDDSDILIGGLAASVKFNVPMNYAQIDLADFTVGVAGVDDGTAFSAAQTAIDVKTFGTGSATNLTNIGDLELLAASNGKSADYNQALLMYVWSGKEFDAGDKFNLAFQHADQDSDSNTAAVYNTPQFTVVSQTIDSSVNAGDITVGPVDGVDEATTTTTKLRVGVNAVTYTVQAQATSTDVEKANIPVVAKVAATSFLPTGEEFSVSGSNTKVDQANEAVYVSGLTGADGTFSVTVTAKLAALDTAYTVEFFVADGTANGAFTAPILVTNTYASTSANAFTVDNSVVSAAEPVLTFSVEDAFGESVSKSATGLVYSVELKAPNSDDLKKYAQVIDGSVSFTFTNWLGAGESEVLTAKLYTGVSTTPLATSFVSGRTVNITLYAPTAATAVLLSTDKITGALVEYNDFITGKKDKVGPTSTTNSKTVTGTVVDANGAGIPGAPVSVSADGVQFLTGTIFSIGTVALVTDASGAFTTEVWVNVKSAAGITVTASSGTFSDTLLITSDLPSDVTGSVTDALNRGNLKFEVDLPSTVLVNTTYAVTASVTDVFGNPVDGAVVKFDGFGGAEFNGVASVTKTTNRDGEAVAYLRSIKDVDGLSAVEISLASVDHNGDSNIDTESISSAVATDVATTSWDESSWTNVVEAEIDFLTSAPASSDQKVNAGSFKGYVALYAKGYEGSRMSAKVGNDWVVVPSVPAATNDLFRAVEFVGAGVDISVRIYIDRVLVATIPLLTK